MNDTENSSESKALKAELTRGQSNVTKDRIAVLPCTQVVQTLQRENISFKRYQIYLIGISLHLTDVIAICLYS